MEKNTNFLQFIKIGSACLFDNLGRLNYSVLKKKAKEIEADENNNVLVVSGAIALGMKKENEKRSKEELSSVELQGYASMGQIYLMEIYKRIFKKNIAQLLVTERELVQTDKIKNLLLENAKKGRITLINYNDCVDFEELRKDNDTLAADIMLYCNGDRLILLGKDYDGFKDKEGNIINRVHQVDEKLYSYCNGKSKYGNGGFKTKLEAAKKIIAADKELIIANISSGLQEIISGKVKRTLFKK